MHEHIIFHFAIWTVLEPLLWQHHRRTHFFRRNIHRVSISWEEITCRFGTTPSQNPAKMAYDTVCFNFNAGQTDCTCSGPLPDLPDPPPTREYIITQFNIQLHYVVLECLSVFYNISPLRLCANCHLFD